ncbi:MAG: integrin alpha [Acidimicrobiales bacterium]
MTTGSASAVDGDGVNDLAVGSYSDDDGGSGRGACTCCSSTATAPSKREQKISDTAGGLSAALDDTDFFGWSIASLGDIDGDGVSDIAVGARFDDDGGTDRGT